MVLEPGIRKQKPDNYTVASASAVTGAGFMYIEIRIIFGTVCGH